MTTIFSQKKLTDISTWSAFSIRDLDRLPSRSGLYAVCRRQGLGLKVFYVGKSKNMRRRWKTHERKEMARVHNCHLRYLIWNNIDADELKLIRLYSPPWNYKKVHNKIRLSYYKAVTKGKQCISLVLLTALILAGVKIYQHIAPLLPAATQVIQK